MKKSEKCYYAIIENKKRGQFSWEGPIQVAKKVASKKLKAGKEMEFYLDEVGHPLAHIQCILKYTKK